MMMNKRHKTTFLIMGVPLFLKSFKTYIQSDTVIQSSFSIGLQNFPKHV
jgi:hypothetical protein